MQKTVNYSKTIVDLPKYANINNSFNFILEVDAKEDKMAIQMQMLKALKPKQKEITFFDIDDYELDQSTTIN